MESYRPLRRAPVPRGGRRTCVLICQVNAPGARDRDGGRRRLLAGVFLPAAPADLPVRCHALHTGVFVPGVDRGKSLSLRGGRRSTGHPGARKGLV